MVLTSGRKKMSENIIYVSYIVFWLYVTSHWCLGTAIPSSLHLSDTHKAPDLFISRARNFCRGLLQSAEAQIEMKAKFAIKNVLL